MSIRKTRSSLLFNSFSAFVLRQVHSSSAVTEHLLEVFLRVDFNERLGIALNAFKECKNLLPKQRQIANKTSDSFINYNEQTNGEVRLWAIMWRAFPTSKHHMWKLTTTRTLQIRFVPLTLKAPAGETWAFFLVLSSSHSLDMMCLNLLKEAKHPRGLAGISHVRNIFMSRAKPFTGSEVVDLI